MQRYVSSTRRRAGPVLLVDDYDDARTSVREALEEAGYSVVEARNGQQALSFLVSQEQRPAVIVLDLQMPVMDGWTFIELLKRYVGLASIPIIIVTAQEPRLERLSHHAVFGCLRAPFELSRLLDMIAACVNPDDLLRPPGTARK
jgi:CheY-like chemotaxis protein